MLSSLAPSCCATFFRGRADPLRMAFHYSSTDKNRSIYILFQTGDPRPSQSRSYVVKSKSSSDRQRVTNGRTGKD